ncbi:MAG: tRNA uridine-5-carboxymethylaminomethyl(34) synthesis GTPase MnmE, partial [Gammaproteobacteria bacterium]|nr:tRNA uridine-5-carboxymethylaminomethyl(34) synthesis GTPase MnmE [Gammaproteobacteria bacterium]
DRLLLVIDDSVSDARPAREAEALLPAKLPRTVLRNKIDLTGRPPGIKQTQGEVEISLSAKTGEGLEHLHQHLKECMGFQSAGEGTFMARRRHLDAIRRAEAHLAQGNARLRESRAGELLAEELRLAQQALSEITGEFTPEDLLGRIFSSFCIGK